VEHTKGDVLVDMDGVLAAFDASVEATISQSYPEIKLVQPRQEFYIHQDYPEEHHVAIKGIWQAQGFYRHLGVVDGAIEGWGKIVETAFKPRICSSPISQNPNCVSEKIGWLEEHFVPSFGYSLIDEALFDRDKTKYIAVALIDDKPNIPYIEKANWKHIVFDAPYNKVSSSMLRLYGWRDPELLSLLSEAARTQ
jgi:5'-nucleotidase